jgi:hypothetical protein
MNYQESNITENQSAARDKTGLAAICSIFLVVPAFIPAAIAVFIYKYFLQFYVQGSWIPYLEEISMLWFPELMRGLIVGAITMYAAKYLFKTFNERVVRYAVLAFWGGIVLLLVTISTAMRGLSMDIIGVIALMVGIGAGLWIDELNG